MLAACKLGVSKYRCSLYNAATEYENGRRLPTPDRLAT